MSPIRSSFGGQAPVPPEPRPEPVPGPSPAGASPPRRPDPTPEPSGFLTALADLLATRGLPVPDGLLAAPPQAYAGQGEATVATMARLRDTDLAERAAKVAGWATRQAERAAQAWETSPLIKELRRRGLAEPERPSRVVGAAFSLKTPLAEWTDDEILDAVDQWLDLAAGS